MRDSNSRHLRCKRSALPTELIALNEVRRLLGRPMKLGKNKFEKMRGLYSNVDEAHVKHEAGIVGLGIRYGSTALQDPLRMNKLNPASGNPDAGFKKTSRL